MAATNTIEANLDQLNENGRREMEDRRKDSEQPVAPEKRKVQRRRQIDPTTCERDYSDDEIEFMHALDEYKRNNGRMFPTCSEILEVIRELGYCKMGEDRSNSLGTCDTYTVDDMSEDEESIEDFDEEMV